MKGNRLLRLCALMLCLLAPLAVVAQTEPAPADDDGIVEGARIIPDSQTEVQAGAYVLRLTNVSPRDGSFEVDMWVWFRWKGSDVRPDQTFELANGVITNRTESDVTVDEDMNYSTARVQGIIYKEFDVRRFPLDNHVIEIAIEDADLEESNLIYVPDQGTELDPSVTVAGWAVERLEPRVESHPYATNYGFRSSKADVAIYSRFILPVSLERTSIGPLFKSFWISLLSVMLGLLAFMVKSDDLDARFGMGVGSIFAASANAFVISDTLPQTTIVTLAEQINLIAVGVIFTSVFISIWSLRLRYDGRDEDSVRLDRNSMIGLFALYIVLNVLVMTFDLSW
ncbi:MAG: hypothetical protein V4804_03170 [Pseudomonadota bacterium]|jgi:hypothetical protein